MPFWTIFWLVVPPVILLGAGFLHYVLTDKGDE